MKHRISIYIIDHKDQRLKNGDVADYYSINSTNDCIRVSCLGDRRYNFLVALHEFIELFLIKEAGINIEDIDKWDCAHEEMGEHPKAPYRKQHKFAEFIEMLVAREIGVDWDKYEKRIEKVSNGKKRLK